MNKKIKQKIKKKCNKEKKIDGFGMFKGISKFSQEDKGDSDF